MNIKKIPWISWVLWGNALILALASIEPIGFWASGFSVGLGTCAAMVMCVKKK